MEATVNTDKRTNVITPDFEALCDKHKVTPTRRQVSEYNNRYGLLAQKDGTSQRHGPLSK